MSPATGVPLSEPRCCGHPCTFKSCLSQQLRLSWCQMQDTWWVKQFSEVRLDRNGHGLGHLFHKQLTYYTHVLTRMSSDLSLSIAAAYLITTGFAEMREMQMQWTPIVFTAYPSNQGRQSDRLETMWPPTQLPRVTRAAVCLGTA